MTNKKEGTKTCYECGKKVFLNKDHYVLLGTYNREISPDDECYFHFQCWADFFKKKVTDRAKIDVERMQSQVMGLLDNPMLKGLLHQVKGTDILANMVSIPLNKDVVVSKEKVKKKIQNGRKRKREKNRKTQMHKV